ncbi:TPR repeat domain-containing protein [Ditylenchus destructor]|uniref:TPR repeat domain-containing protein n=1 Tax=Ditylenchus destructor TaxID=166010 RepID=A0AAD4NKX4_9BILA|nr:TPR repeat domain-containing protein [Ditylenchus destructor]
MSTIRDKAVLNLILNPVMPTQDWDQTSETNTDSNLSHLPNYEESEQIQMEGIKLAESGNFEEALKKFDEAIRLCPENPSPYNNRAQVLRLQENADIEGAITDLNRAIELSGSKGKSAAQAFSQRALIHQLRGDNDSAKDDYESAAALGSTFAKTQLVALNPYAAMCNAMLADVFAKTQRGEPTEKKE